MWKIITVCAATAFICVPSANAVYLNDSNISVSLGASMAAEPFANRTTAASLASVIDAPTATSSEDHLQSTHVWVSGGTLELDFDFGIEYDVTTVHFWNYFAEGFDVDEIDFQFFDGNNNLVGSLLDVMPALGGAGGNPIFSEDIPVAFPSNVRFVNAVLSGSNNQVDFNNIGFTAQVSDPNPNPVSEPVTLALFGLGLAGLSFARRRKFA